MYTRHKKPLIIGVMIVGLAVLTSTSIYVVSSFLPNKPDVPVDPEPKDVDELIQKYNKCKEEKKDPLEVFKIYELGNLTTHLFTRRNQNYLTVGQGENNSAGTVYVSNALIKKDNKGFEESISFASGLAAAFAKSKRDYLEESVTSYEGTCTDDKYVANWKKDNPTKWDSSKAFYESVGKLPTDPFVYDISKESVLDNGSSKEKTNEGYKIVLNLDPKLSTTRYSKRVRYMGGFAPEFDYVTLTFYTDDDFNLLRSEVSEAYYITVVISIKNIGSMKTTYYTKDIPDIPDINNNFNYTNYIK